MPYRVDVARAGDAVLDPPVELGALDVERLPGGGIAALMPDGAAPEHSRVGWSALVLRASW